MSADKTETVQAEKKPASKDGGKKKGIFARLKETKRLEIIVAVVIGIVIFAIYFSTFDGFGSASKENGNTQSLTYAESARAELERVLGAIKGAGDVKVMIQFESTPEKLIAYITQSTVNSGGTQSSSTPQIITSNGSQSPLLLKELAPRVLGVVVVAGGAGTARVKIDIINAVTTLYEIDVSRVVVLTGN